MVGIFKFGRKYIHKKATKDHLYTALATSLCFVLLMIVLIISSVSVHSLEWGYRYVFFGFSMITLYVKALFSGSEILLNDQTNNGDVITGVIIYFLFVYFSYYLAFITSRRSALVRKISLAATTVFIILVYLFFEMHLLGFATI